MHRFSSRSAGLKSARLSPRKRAVGHAEEADRAQHSQGDDFPAAESSYMMQAFPLEVRSCRRTNRRRFQQLPGLHKGAITQRLGPGRVLKGLGVAKRYCISESNGKWLTQRPPRPGPGAPLEAGQSRCEARPLPLGVPGFWSKLLTRT